MDHGTHFPVTIWYTAPATMRMVPITNMRDAPAINHSKPIMIANPIAVPTISPFSSLMTLSFN
jgi:hypothetical protein